MKRRKKGIIKRITHALVVCISVRIELRTGDDWQLKENMKRNIKDMEADEVDRVLSTLMPLVIYVFMQYWLRMLASFFLEELSHRLLKSSSMTMTKVNNTRRWACERWDRKRETKNSTIDKMTPMNRMVFLELRGFWMHLKWEHNNPVDHFRS